MIQFLKYFFFFLIQIKSYFILIQTYIYILFIKILIKNYSLNFFSNKKKKKNRNPNIIKF